MKKISIAYIFLLSFLTAAPLLAQDEQKPAADDAAAIAKKLANPIGALISLPFQNNMDIGIGDYNGSRNTLNIQPIVPFSLNAKYSLITRYIVPVIAQHDITGENTRQSGLADALGKRMDIKCCCKKRICVGCGCCIFDSNRYR